MDLFPKLLIPKVPTDEKLTFLIENAPGAVEQANEEFLAVFTTIVKSMKNFTYRDAASEKQHCQSGYKIDNCSCYE